MKMMLPVFICLGAALAGAQDRLLPAGYWSEAKAIEILSRTETVRLAPDLSGLADGERAALAEILQAGDIMQRLYEDSRHPQALAARASLQQLDRAGRTTNTEQLLTLYDLFQGPIATTLENAREPFLPVSPQVPARNVYPADLTRAELDAFVAAHPERRASLLDERTIVRRATPDNLSRDVAALGSGPLAALHGAFARDLRDLSTHPDPKVLYAVPFAVAYAPELMRAFTHLMAAADHLEASDGEFARYLRNRARDFLTNDYESGDASWVTGRFTRFNAQIGAYETYDDALTGRKAFHGLSLLLQNERATAELRRDLGGLQEIENALPYEHHKRVRDDISVGVYDVIADFGQARGTNTATILPNDALFSRRYGRTILLRENIMTHPDIFAADMRIWRTATADPHAADLTGDGNFRRTLWHEIGHYLGVDRDRNGRPLDVALEEWADALEEMKADLVSLFAAQAMRERGTLSEAALRAVQASGIRRVILNIRPRSDQPYQVMQLAQFNYFVDKGLLVPEPGTGRLTVQYERYPATVASLLREVLGVQYRRQQGCGRLVFRAVGRMDARRARETGCARARCPGRAVSPRPVRRARPVTIRTQDAGTICRH